MPSIKNTNIVLKILFPKFKNIPVCFKTQYKLDFCNVQQILTARLQKERDTYQEECEKLQEKVEVQQSQISKAQRDKENMITELEVFKERCEKAQQNQQKLQVLHVSINYSYC